MVEGGCCAAEIPFDVLGKIAGFGGSCDTSLRLPTAKAVRSYEWVKVSCLLHISRANTMMLEAEA